MPDIKTKVLDIKVLEASKSVNRASFTTPLIASLQAGFSENIRFYESAEDAAADGDLSSGLQSKLATMYQNSGGQIAVGKLSASVKQVTTLTLAGAEDGDYVITIGDTDYTHTASSDTATAICTALQVLTDVNPLLVATVTGAVITLTAASAGVPFDVLASAPGASSWVEVEATANVSITTGLNDLRATSDEWRHLLIDSRVDSVNIEAAAWAETNKTHFYFQTSSADVKTVATSDIMSTLSGLGYKYTHMMYKADDAINYAEALAARYSSIDPDAQAGQAFLAQLVGVPEEELSATEVTNILAKNGNFYASLKKVTAHFQGVQADGKDIEYSTAVRWLEERIDEDFSQFLLNETNLNRRPGLNDTTFARLEGLILKRAGTGQNIGHIDASVTPEVSYPARIDMPSEDVSARIFRFKLGVQFNVGIKGVSGIIFLPLTFTGL